jgi:hypothetical protein
MKQRQQHVESGHPSVRNVIQPVRCKMSPTVVGICDYILHCESLLGSDESRPLCHKQSTLRRRSFYVDITGLSGFLLADRGVRTVHECLFVAYPGGFQLRVVPEFAEFARSPK